MDSVAKACCYMITNDINNKMYIGVTTSFNSRMASHKHSPNTKMKIDIDKYGWDSFSKEVLFYGTEDYCYYMEPILIKEYNSTYNIMIGGKTGSGVSGEDNGNSKFTDIEIKNIRLDYATGLYTMVELEHKYGSCNSYISSIISGFFRKEAGGPIDSKSKVRKLTPKLVLEIRNHYFETREGYSTIAKKYTVGKTNIGKIVRGERWKEVGGPIKGIDYEI